LFIPPQRLWRRKERGNSRTSIPISTSLRVSTQSSDERTAYSCAFFVPVNPTYMYGPFVPGFYIKKGDIGGLATNGFLLDSVLSGKKLEPLQKWPAPFPVDVRDVAKAHILALKSTAKFSGHKRILVSGPVFNWKDAVLHLAKTRPELKGRLNDVSEVLDHPAATFDNSRAREILGFGERIDWKKTVDDAVDSLLEVEKAWGGFSA